MKDDMLECWDDRIPTKCQNSRWGRGIGCEPATKMKDDMLECRDVRIPGMLNRMAGGRTLGCQDGRCQIFWCLNAICAPGCQNAEMQECQDVRVSEWRVTGLEDASMSVCQDAIYKGGMTSEYRDAKMPGCQDARMTGNRDNGMPVCTD